MARLDYDFGEEVSKLVYISGPYSAPTKLEVEANINVARDAAVWCAKNGVFYFCPHLNSVYFEQWLPEVNVTFFYVMDHAILARCDAILLVGKWWDSKGAAEELMYAVINGKKIFYFDSEQNEVLQWYKENK